MDSKFLFLSDGVVTFAWLFFMRTMKGKGKAEVKNPSLMPYVMKTQDMDTGLYVLLL